MLADTSRQLLLHANLEILMQTNLSALFHVSFDQLAGYSHAN